MVLIEEEKHVLPRRLPISQQTSILKFVPNVPWFISTEKNLNFKIYTKKIINLSDQSYPGQQKHTHDYNKKIQQFLLKMWAAAAVAIKIEVFSYIL